MPAKRRAPKRDALIAPEILSPRSRSACIGQYWVSSALPGHWKFSRACRPAAGVSITKPPTRTRCDSAKS